VHQCARFSVDPKVEHASAVRWLARHLKGARDKGFITRPDGSGLEVFVDADFSGNWDADIACFNKDTARSRHGHFVMFAGCPIVWASQSQQEIALSSTESELTGLSHAPRSAIPVVRLMTELKQNGFVFRTSVPRSIARFLRMTAAPSTSLESPRSVPNPNQTPQRQAASLPRPHGTRRDDHTCHVNTRPIG
jgi:hypothetical protein